MLNDVDEPKRILNKTDDIYTKFDPDRSTLSDSETDIDLLIDSDENFKLKLN